MVFYPPLDRWGNWGSEGMHSFPFATVSHGDDYAPFIYKWAGPEGPVLSRNARVTLCITDHSRTSDGHDNHSGAECVQRWHSRWASAMRHCDSEGRPGEKGLHGKGACSVPFSDQITVGHRVFYFQLAPNLVQVYHLLVICAAWKELRVRYRKKVGVLLGLPAGQHTGLLLTLFF